MAIFSDNIGNHYLGDCLWANHNPTYSSQNYLKAHPYSSIISEIQSWFSISGNLLSFIVDQSTFDGYLNVSNTPLIFDFLRGSFSGDLFGSNPRFKIRLPNHGYFSTGSYNGVQLLSGGSDGTSNNTTNNLVRQSLFANTNFDSISYPFRIGNNESLNAARTWVDVPTWCGVMDSYSMGLLVCRYSVGVDGIVQLQGGGFHYIGILADINTNQNYYSSNINNQYVLITSYFRNYGETTHYLGVVRGSHLPPSQTGRNVLENGVAIYPISCADGQTPTEVWATDFYVFDNDTANNRYPAMGRVRNMLLGQGNYTLLKPVRIQGGIKPDAGFNCWLPIGYWGDKTLLVRCYSSV